MVCDCDLVFLRGRVLGWRLCICQCVRSFVRRGFLRTFWELRATFGEPWGPLELHSRSSGGSLGYHFGISGDLLGFIWWALGVSWGPFWSLLGASGGPWGLFGRPWQPRSFPSQGTGKLATPPTLDFGALACTGCYFLLFGQAVKRLKRVGPRTLTLHTFGG